MTELQSALETIHTLIHLAEDRFNVRCLRIKNSNRFLVIDDEDFELVNGRSWGLHSTRFTEITAWVKERQKVLSVHRLVMNDPSTEDKLEIDHANRDVHDNRKKNLRLATHSQNNANKVKYLHDASSKYKGVTWHKANGYWQAQLKTRGINYYLGKFETEVEAALAYDRKAKEVHGEFARTNF